MFSQIRQSQSGFSLVEIMVGTVLTTVIVYGATSVTHSHYESSRHLKKKSEGDERSVNNKFFSRKFISLLDDSDISVRYFKLPIKLSSESPHCGEVASGGCFMSLNEKGKISSVFDDGNGGTFHPLKVTDVSGIGINFFNDESTPRDLRKLSVVGDVDKQVISLNPVKYNSKVRMSVKKKYYVGWKLGDNESSAFPIMSRTKNKFFLSVPSSSIEVGHNNFDHEAHSKKFFAEVVNFGDDNNLSEEEGGGELEDYTDMFYLYYKSNDPSIWGVFLLESIMKCKKEGDGGNDKSFEQKCKNHYESLLGTTTVDWNAACDGGEESSGKCAIRKDAELKLGDYHLVTISDPSTRIAEFLPKAGSDNGIVSEELWLDQSGEDYPYFPYKTSSVVKGDGSPLSPLEHLDAPTSPHALIHSLQDKDMRVILFPVVFHKFFLKNRGEHKDLMTISDIEKRDGKIPDVVVRSLLSKAKVIFARQLGTMRISSFIFDNKKEDEENEEQEEDEEEGQTSEEQENTQQEAPS